MYGSNATLKEMARSDPSTFPSKIAQISRPRGILRLKRVTLTWLTWQVAREEITPEEASWVMCPNVDPLHSGYVKLMAVTTLVFKRWVGFYQECGYDAGQDYAIKKELIKIWGLKEDVKCHLLPKK